MRAPGGRSSELVGRAPELAALSRFLDAVAQGSAALVLEGDAGIGKTALLAAGTALADERGYRVLLGRPTESETQLPFAALGDLLDALPEDVRAGLPEPQRRALDVAMLRADWDGPPIERRAVALAMLNALRGLADRAPVIMAIDDVQWLDPPSAAALQFALRRLETERVGLLAARRGRGSDLPFDLAEALPAERSQRLEIGPLTRDSLARLLLVALRTPLPHPAVVQVHRVSAGNPYFALEIARALERREVGLVPGEPFPVPQSLRELVRDRLEHLPPSARQTCLVVAALPQPTVERVEAATGGKGGDADGLGQALVAGIVEIEGDRVRFTHSLLGSIIYSETSPSGRRELHAHLATLTGDVEERARHLALAAPGPDEDIAAELDEAGLRALLRGAPEAAAELLEHARRLTPLEDREHRWRRDFEAADCHLKAGDSQAAGLLLSNLVAEAPPGNVRARARIRLAEVMAFEGDWQTAGELRADVLRETDDPRIQAASEQGLAWVEWSGGDLRAAVLHIRAAVSFAERSGDRTDLAEVLGEQAFMEGMLGEQRTDAILQRALSVADPAAPIRMTRQPDRWATALAVWSDELERAGTIAYAERQKAVEAGDEHVLANVLDGLTDVERLRGDWAAAARLADEMYRATVQTSQEFMRAFALSKQALVHALMGLADQAGAEAREGIGLAERTGALQPKLFCLHVLGFLELSLDNAEKAHEHLETAVTASAAAGIGEPGALRFVPDDVEALVLLGRLDAAASTLEPFEERAVALGRRWATGAAARCRALLVDAREGPAAALPLIEAAVEHHERTSQPFELARTLLVRGQIQRRAKQKAAARATLERARSIFDTLGAPFWSQRAARELARIGGRTRRARGLTPTEERVAELAAEGLTNREIAAALHLSVNTVQAYLKRIYRELGIRSRTELARMFPTADARKEH